jgi:hypothetical protein
MTKGRHTMQTMHSLQEQLNEIIPPPGSRTWSTPDLTRLVPWLKYVSQYLHADELNDSLMTMIRVALTAVLQCLSKRGDIPTPVVEWMTTVLVPVVFRNAPMTVAQAEMVQVLLNIFDLLGKKVVPIQPPP